MENNNEEIKQLESKIYKAFYKENPEGDARVWLWREVLDAKKTKNPVNELTELLETFGV